MSSPCVSAGLALQLRCNGLHPGVRRVMLQPPRLVLQLQAAELVLQNHGLYVGAYSCWSVFLYVGAFSLEEVAHPYKRKELWGLAPH